MGRQDSDRRVLPKRDSTDLRRTDKRTKSELLEGAACKTTARQGRWKVGCEPRQFIKGITVRELGARTVTGLRPLLSRIPQDLMVGLSELVGILPAPLDAS